MRHVSMLAMTLVCGCSNPEMVERFDFSGPPKDLSLPGLDLAGADLSVQKADMPSCAGADLMNDTDNCGRCGRSCGTGVCTMGRCPLTTLYANRADPVGLAVDATNVYWTEVGNTTNGYVYKGSLAGGGSPTNIANGLERAGGIVVSGTKLIWTASGATDSTGKVQWLPTTTSTLTTPNTIASGEAYPLGLVTDGTTVFWTNHGTGMASYLDGALRKSTISAPSPTTIGDASGLAGPSIPVLSGTTVFFTVRGSTLGYTDGAVLEIGTTGTMRSSFAAAQTDPFGIAVDAANVYWVSTLGNAVYKQPLTGGSPTPVATSQSYPLHIAVDATGIYWTNAGTADNSGSVMFAPLSGGTPLALAINQNHPVKLVLDTTSVYWVNEGSGATDGAVMKTVK